MLTLVMLPGMDGTGQLFVPLIDALGPAVHAQPVAYPCDQPLGYDALLQQVLQHHVPRKGPWVLLAESFSGPIALQVAARAPAGLKGLVLCNTFAKSPAPALVRSLPGLPWLPVRWAPALAMSRVMLGRWAKPETRQALADAVAQVAAPVWRQRIQAVMAVDVTAHLPTVKLPVLCLHASDDQVVPPSALAWLRQHLPRSEAAQLPGPHALLQACPGPAAQAILGFCQHLAVAP
jgi:pimeloyl-ACP methyl ester carboxylesterase